VARPCLTWGRRRRHPLSQPPADAQVPD
jgi:hypothetical protein